MCGVLDACVYALIWLQGRVARAGPLLHCSCLSYCKDIGNTIGVPVGCLSDNQCLLTWQETVLIEVHCIRIRFAFLLAFDLRWVSGYSLANT